MGRGFACQLGYESGIADAHAPIADAPFDAGPRVINHVIGMHGLASGSSIAQSARNRVFGR